MSPRFSELDQLRTLAIIGMVVYHAAYDLASFYGWNIDINHVGWLILERTVAITFLLLVGISFAISYSRTKSDQIWRKFLKRGLIVFGCGMLVSVATYIVDPTTYVRFGILHLIGLSIILLPLFARRKMKNPIFVFGACPELVERIILVIFVFFVIFKIPTSGTTALIPLGFPPSDFQTVDYFPLFPWFGFVLIGLALGNTFYVKNIQWRNHLPKQLTTHHSLITHPSRFALLIYLVHQPMLLAVFWIIKKVSW